MIDFLTSRMWFVVVSWATIVLMSEGLRAVHAPWQLVWAGTTAIYALLLLGSNQWRNGE